MHDFATALAMCPLIAILRGVRPDEAVEIGAALVDAGFRIIEVPLNSPDPIHSIRLLVERLSRDAVIGAGTVITPSQVEAVAEAGGRLIVMPHADAEVIRAAKAEGLVCLPGIATPTEAFRALAAGADGLKLFPAEAISPAVVKSLRAVLDPAVKLFPVGGIGAANMQSYIEAGCAGFGIGSTLYRAGRTADEVGAAARMLKSTWRAAALQVQ